MFSDDPGRNSGAAMITAIKAVEYGLPATSERPNEAMRRSVLARLVYDVGKDADKASQRDWFLAASMVTRDRIVDHWTLSRARVRRAKGKEVCYFSLEFLVGRLLFDAVSNLGMTQALRGALSDTGLDLERLRIEEKDPALGNGGLGRLAACFMESMATVGVPATGYGIRYEHGLFRQVIIDGRQHELPEDWLSFGNPWEFERPEITYDVGFGGSVAVEHDAEGRVIYQWHAGETVSAVAYDTPVVGLGGEQINTLRLWSARSKEAMQLEDFNRGDHIGASSNRMRVEAISRVLYPGDESAAGQELRLRQEFFFTSASLQDLIRRHLERFGDIQTLAAGVAIQINDTHPAIGIVELMRLLLDVHGVEWEQAWAITNATFSYTNHTLMPEALEVWPVSLMERLLPRHMQIIYLINVRHLEGVRRRLGGDDDTLAVNSVIDENHGRRVRMGTLAFIGSHKVNGVSALHSELMRKTVFRDLNRIYPDRIVNKTNGITFRRWLHYANPGLSGLIVETIGEHALRDPERLRDLARFADDAGVRERFAGQRLAAKRVLADTIAQSVGVTVDPTALFDVHIKRIHEYKRQLLNLLQTIAQYQAILTDPGAPRLPVVKIFAGKAAAGYHRAKQIIRLAHDVARVVNNDHRIGDALKVAFIPNYNVSLAEQIVPAADLSEQISTAGMEASGTGNMKLALNGALTIGTLDGANIEIRERVGEDNMFIFGLTAEENEQRRRTSLQMHEVIAASPVLSGVLKAIVAGQFSPDEPERYRDLVWSLEERDAFMVLADFDAYGEAQARVGALWHDKPTWWRRSIANTSAMGWFSSDRTIREYAEEIWKVPTQHLS